MHINVWVHCAQANYFNQFDLKTSKSTRTVGLFLSRE